MTTSFHSKERFITNRFIVWIIFVGISGISAMKRGPSRLLTLDTGKVKHSQTPLTTTIINVVIDEVLFHPPCKGIERGCPSPILITQKFPNSLEVAIQDLTFESFIHSLRSRILSIFLKIEQDLPAHCIRDKLPENRINSIKDVADVSLRASPETMYIQSIYALSSYGIDGQNFDGMNINNCGNARFESRPEWKAKEWIHVSFTVQDRIQALEKIQLDWGEFVKRLRLEKEIDAITMKEYPEGNRPASPVARDQGQEPICWMMAAASLLRTKHEDLTEIPHIVLVDEMKKIEKEVRGFWKEFRRKYDEDKVTGMTYWIKSEWWKLTQTPDMKKAYPFDWTESILQESFLEQLSLSKGLILQKFWNLHGFSFVEKFESEQHQEPKIREMLQKERALIALAGSSWERVIKELPESPPDFENEPGHFVLLDRFDSGYYFLKNSHGPTGGSRGATDGKVRILEDVFKDLDYTVYFIGKTHSTHTSLEENGWMWAVATVSQTKRGNRYPLQELVEEVKEQWYTLLAFSEWRERINIQSGHWSAEQDQDWRRTGWWNVDSEYPNNKPLVVTDKYLDSKGLQCSEGMSFSGASAKQMKMLKQRLQESPVQTAVILFDPFSWKRMVTKFTKFYEINGDGSDPGESQLVVLMGSFRKAHGEVIFFLKDTHGLNGHRTAEHRRSIIKVPEEDLRALHFEVWFVEDVQTQALPSPYTFVANGKHLSDLKDVYRVDFIDAETKEKKWFVIDVMYEIEINHRDEMQRDLGLTKSFDVYIGKAIPLSLPSGRIQLNLKRIGQPNGIEIEWDDTKIQIRNIRLLSTTQVSNLPQTSVESVLRKLITEGGKLTLRHLQILEPEDSEETGWTPEQQRLLATYYRPNHRCAEKKN